MRSTGRRSYLDITQNLYKKIWFFPRKTVETFGGGVILDASPGAVIDDEGTGWLSFGGGGKREVGTDYMPALSAWAKT